MVMFIEGWLIKLKSLFYAQYNIKYRTMKVGININRTAIRKRLVEELNARGIILGRDGRKLSDQNTVELGNLLNHLENKEVVLTKKNVWIEFERFNPKKMVIANVSNGNYRVSLKKAKKKNRAKPKNKKEPHWKDKYLEYLKSKEWKAIRVKLFQLRGRKCEECDATRFLQIHHKTYIRLYHEKMDDLQILCRECHKAEHNIK